MKTRNIFLTLVALLGLTAVSCEKETEQYLSEIKVSQSYVSLPAEGSTVEITVTAEDAWAFDKVFTVETGEKDAEGKAITTTVETPDWLTVTPLSGEAGETAVKFTAAAAEDTREASLSISCLGQTQIINVVQMTEKKELPITPIAEVISTASGSFRVKGTVTKVASTDYGNYYMVDESYDGDSFEIYGTLVDGAYPKDHPKGWAAFDIAVGDVLTVEGVYSEYKGTHELVDVEIIDHVKSLIKVDPSVFSVAKGDTTVVAKVLYSGDEFEFSSDANWLNVAGVSKSADTTFVSIHVAANTEDTRTGNVILKSYTSSASSEVTVTVTQAAGFAAFPLPFENALTDNQGAWTIEGEGVWKQDSKYGMVGSASEKADITSSLISPKIDLATATSPILTFEHVQKYAGNVYNELSLWVSIDNCESWEEIQIPCYPDGKSWDYIPSGSISLARFAGNLVNLKFQYKATTSNNAKWEIKNVKVVDGTLSVANVAEINNFAAKTEASWSGTLTNAVVSYVNGGNAFIQDETGGIQLYKSNHGLTAGQTINGTVSGKVKIYNGYAELTDFDASAATVADGTVPEAVTLTIDQLFASYLRYQNCKVLLEGVTLSAAIDKANNRDTKVKQGTTEIAGRAQTKTIEIAADVEGDLLCWPCRYNTTLQLGIWESGHFTTAAAAATVVIDGDFADWAALPEANVAVISAPEQDYQELKVAYDKDNLYFYSKRNLARHSEWPFYIWYKIDINGAGTYAKAFYFYPYAKESTELSIVPNPSSSEISGLTLKCAGLEQESTVELEVSVPRSELGIEKGMAIAVQSVMNKVSTGSTLTTPSLTIAE